MDRLALALALLCAPAAAEVPTWSGATDRACDGRCEPGIALAAAPISDEWRAEILAVMDEPQRCVTIRDGAILYGTSYWQDGEQRYDARRHYVDGEWIACGWWTAEDGRMRGFVKLLACGNWQPVSQPALVRPIEPAQFSAVSTALLPPIYTPGGARLSTLPLGAGWDDGRVTVRVEPDLDTLPDAPAPIPLPGAIWMLLAALGGLAMMRWRSR